MRYIKKTQKTALSIIFLLMLSVSTNAQWNIPEEAKNNTPLLMPTYELVNKGKEIYKVNNCASCHGFPGEGKNNTAIEATELGSSLFLKHKLPGEIYWQIGNGKGQMPPFKNTLSEEEIWLAVFYIKSFDKDFEIGGEKTVAKNADFELKKDKSASQVFANVVIINKNGDTIPGEGVDINFYVKRIFGNLQIGDPVTTNQVGTAVFNFPDDIPGDEEGNVEIIASFKDSDSYGTIMKSIELNWGIPLHFENPVLERSLWGPNDRVPLWLLFSYLLVTGGVWITIFYVIFQIIKLKRAGQ